MTQFLNLLGATNPSMFHPSPSTATFIVPSESLAVDSPPSAVLPDDPAAAGHVYTTPDAIVVGEPSSFSTHRIVRLVLSQSEPVSS